MRAESARWIATVVALGAVVALCACSRNTSPSSAKKSANQNEPTDARGAAGGGETASDSLPAGHPPIDTTGSMPQSAQAPTDPTVAEFGPFTAPVPPDWEWHPPQSRMRAANYFVPAANDGAPAEVVVFQGIGGSPQANIMRWQGQVRGADGQPVEAETSSLEVAGVPVTMVELQGQYVGMGQQPPQDDQIFLGAVIEAPSGDLHVRFVGDQTTVEANRDDFMAMIQGLQRKETNAGGNAAAPPTNPDDSAAEVTIEDDWFFRVRGIERLRQMEGNKAPDLMVKDWVGQPRSLADLRGKVVVVDFWGTWCPPCMMAIPKNVELVEKYGDDGLVMLGVHDFSKGTEKIPQVVERMNINYPVATDDGGASQRAWRVSFWPTYFVIDQQGIVRAAGIDPKFLENVITQLLPQAS